MQRGWKLVIENDFNERGYSGAEWIHLVLSKIHWLAV
jgi:hypothetical protein